jgi:hypothetical protein
LNVRDLRLRFLADLRGRMRAGQLPAARGEDDDGRPVLVYFGLI